MHNAEVKKLLDEGGSWSSMWLDFDIDRYGYDEHFKEVISYVRNNNIKNRKKS